MTLTDHLNAIREHLRALKAADIGDTPAQGEARLRTLWATVNAAIASSLKNPMTELFQTEPQDSPRLKWMKRHGVKTEPIRPDYLADAPSIIAFTEKKEDEHGVFYGISGIGKTEDEAIVALAKANGWRLWNEEAL